MRRYCAPAEATLGYRREVLSIPLPTNCRVYSEKPPHRIKTGAVYFNLDKLYQNWATRIIII